MHWFVGGVTQQLDRTSSGRFSHGCLCQLRNGDKGLCGRNVLNNVVLCSCYIRHPTRKLVRVPLDPLVSLRSNESLRY